MYTSNEKFDLRLSLAQAIEEWIEDQGKLPPLSEDLTAYMADAAAAVLFGIADAQKYLEYEGRLFEPE